MANMLIPETPILRSTAGPTTKGPMPTASSDNFTPKVSHHGIALGDCTTFSVGFRTPAATEMLDDLATELLTGIVAPIHLLDPPLTPAMAVDQIPNAYIQRVRALLLDTLDDEALLAQWFAQFMTAPKYPMLVEQTGEQRRASIEDKNGAIIQYENGIQE